MRGLAAAVVFILAACCPAFCCYSGFLVVPSTDLVSQGQYSVEVQNDLLLPVRSQTSSTFFNTQFGVTKDVEAGLDFDMSDTSDSRMIGNFKYRYSAGSVPVAAGISSLNGSFKSIPYICMGPSFSFGRITFGAIRNQSRDRWYAGFDRAISSKLTLMADYTSGKDNLSSVAVNLALSESFSILAGAEFPNDGSTNTIYSVHLVMCGCAFGS